MEMAPTGARTLELSRALAADTPSVHRLSNEQTHTEQANIGVVGLAVMGANLARNLASREGNTVAV